MYYAYDEIFKQGESLKKTYNHIKTIKNDIKNFFDKIDYKIDYNEVVFIACGSSFWMSLSASMSWQEIIKKPCFAVKSGDVVCFPDYYKNAYKNPVFIVPSRSGRTSETLMALDILKKHYNAPVFSIVANDDSPLSLISDFTLNIKWSHEISICQTRTFSNLYAASLLIADIIAGDGRLSSEIYEYINEFDKYSKDGENIVKGIINGFPECKTIVSLSCGKMYGIAVEGAYIAIEMAQFNGLYYGTLEYRHGPVVNADENVLVSILSTINNNHEEQMAEEIIKTGARVLSITSDYNFINANYKALMNKKVCHEVLALYGIFIMQAFAYYKACDLGRNPDKPKDLVSYIEI